MGPLFHLEENRCINIELLQDVANELPTILVERGGHREAISPRALGREQWFWTVDCAFFRSAEMLIREVPSTASLSSLASALSAADIELPDGPIVCGLPPERGLAEAAFIGKEVDKISVRPAQRRIDFRWGTRTDPPRWRVFRPRLELIRVMREQPGFRFSTGLSVVVGQSPVEISGLSDEMAVRGFGTTYFLPNCPAAEFLTLSLDRSENEASREEADFMLALVISVFASLLDLGAAPPNVEEFVRRHVDSLFRERPRPLRRFEDTEFAQLHQVIKASSWRVFDPSAWSRGRDF